MVLARMKDIKYTHNKVPVGFQKSQRVVAKGPKPHITSENCAGCELCVVVCPHDCITMKNGVASIHYDHCTGCLVCLRECPSGSITE